MTVLCAIIALVGIAAGVIIMKISKSQKGIARSLAFACVAMLVFSLGMELSVFNINFYTSHGNNPISLNSYLDEYKNEDGTYTFSSGGTELLFDNINADINNIYFDVSEKVNPSAIKLSAYLTDKGNEYFLETPERTIYSDNEKSQYINVHTNGKSEKLKLKTESSSSIEKINVNGIYLNTERPFYFSFARIVLLFGILLFIYIFKPSSFLYKRKIVDNNDLTKSLMYAFICLECAVIIILGTVNPTFMGIASGSYNSYDWDGKGIDFISLSMENHNEYDELAQAILKGKTYIDNDDVPESLKELDNPYDLTARTYASYESGDSYRWDVAYYNGHYYVYFGIVPELLMYLPFRAVTGSPFPTAVGIMVFALVFTIGVYKLLLLLAQKKFKNLSVGSFILTALTFVNCCGAMFLVKRPDFYSIPIITGMAFTVWGLYNWIKGLEVPERRNLHFLLGSICMALVAGCRPQMVLLSFLALPLFFKKFIVEKEFKTKNGIKELILLGVPYIVVAAGIMYYNAIRFGSPVDFGSSYNLTTNDVTNRGFDVGRIGLGVFTYLFQTPVFTAVFPFIKNVDIDTNYVGLTIVENCFGGLITSLPFLWFIFAIRKAKAELKDKKLFAFTLISLIIGFIIVIADAEAGGLLQRYYSDFGFVFFLAASLVIFALREECCTSREVKTLNTFVYFSAILSIFYSVALAISVSDVTIDTQNPTVFAFICETVQFWL